MVKIKCMLQFMYLCSACSTINLTSKLRFFRLYFKVNTCRIISKEIILVVKCPCYFKYLGACLHWKMRKLRVDKINPLSEIKLLAG